VTQWREISGSTLPPRLLDLGDPPERLYLHGELPRGPAVAIVGTRRPSPRAREFGRKLARELGSAGVVILSGGALGIDSEAHEGALLGGGPTVVVAPAGFERPYPPENAALFRRVLDQGGAYLSPRAPNEAAELGVFFRRNAVLVALSHAVIVVEAPVRSGARNAAQCARQLGRPLLVVPAAPWNVRGRGCILELKLGARPLSSFRDVLRVLAEQRLHPIPLEVRGHDGVPGEPPARRPRTAPAARTPAESVARFGDLAEGDELRAVLAALRSGASHTDELAESLGVPAREVQRSVLTLTLYGEVVMDQSGRIRLVESR
jgi:DNA processing protein